MCLYLWFLPEKLQSAQEGGFLRFLAFFLATICLSRFPQSRSLKFPPAQINIFSSAEVVIFRL